MNKVYVVLKHEIYSGGMNTLNQFINVLKDSNYKVYKYYIDDQTLSLFPEDTYDNVLVVPETMTYVCRQFSKIKKVIWWLSLDFYMKDSNYRKYLYQDFECFIANVYASCINNKIVPIVRPLYFVYRLLKLYLPTNCKNLTLRELRKIDAHFYNVVYERDFLEKIMVRGSLMYQCGPIDKEFFDNNSYDKEDVVLFNPQKADFYTYAVISEIKKITGDTVLFIPLCNMSKNELLESYDRAKIYMDFGFFPGPERMPREAVTRGCNIIVALRGAACNYEDVPIPNKYKVKYTYKRNIIKSTAMRLLEMLNNYHEDYKDFEEYRLKVVRQRENFENNVIENLEKIGISKALK